MAQVKLAFNPAKGVKYEYSMEILSTISQDIMGQSMNVESNMTMIYEMKVTDKTASGVKVDMKYVAASMEVVNPMMNMNYDSRKPEAASGEGADMLAKIFGSLIDKSFQMEVKPDGTVTSVTGMDAIIDAMVENMGATAEQAAAMKEQMAEQFGEEGIRKSFEQGFKIYPEGAVKVGDSWEKTLSTSLMGGVDMEIKANYTLKSADGKAALVDLKSTVSGFNGSLSGTQNGTLEFDVKTGLPMKSNSVQEIKGTISMQGMEIPMELNVKTNLTVKKID